MTLTKVRCDSTVPVQPYGQQGLVPGLQCTRLAACSLVPGPPFACHDLELFAALTPGSNTTRKTNKGSKQLSRKHATR